MFKILNIEKSYFVDETIEKVVLKFESLISAPFNNSKFTTFGGFVATEPPEFLLMNKGISIGRPMLPEIASTKAFIKIFNDDNKIELQLTTRINPSILVFFFVFLIIGIINIFFLSNNIISAGVCLLLSVLCLVFDRFIKNILIANIEKDANLMSMKKAE